MSPLGCTLHTRLGSSLIQGDNPQQQMFRIFLVVCIKPAVSGSVLGTVFEESNIPGSQSWHSFIQLSYFLLYGRKILDKIKMAAQEECLSCFGVFWHIYVLKTKIDSLRVNINGVAAVILFTAQKSEIYFVRDSNATPKEILWDQPWWQQVPEHPSKIIQYDLL